MAEAQQCPNCGREMPAHAPHGLCPACLLAGAQHSQVESHRRQGEPASTAATPADPAGTAVDSSTEFDRTATSVFSRQSDPSTDSAPTVNFAPSGGPAHADGSIDPGARIRYFGDYEIRGELGSGAMGVVYRARQISLNRSVALKMVRAGALAREEDLRRFQNEAEAVARLDHPHIVPIYEVGEHEGQRYLTTKLIGGPCLSRTLSAYTAKPQHAAQLVGMIAEAVHHAHQRGILHRDLKPSNILLDEQGQPHVSDFGLAKHVEGDNSLTESGAVLGTPAYMAPEQAAGTNRLVTTLSDVYGLGAILYALLTGKPPFGGDSAMETLDRVRQQQPIPPARVNPNVPRDLEIICLKCLEKDTQRRYASAQALAAELRRFLGGEPIQARPVSAFEKSWRWCRRRPALSAAMLAATAAVLLLIAGSLYYNARLRDSVRKLRAAEQAALHQSNVTTKALNGLIFELQDRLGKTAETRALRKGLLDTAIDGLDQVALNTATALPDLGRAVAHQKLGDIYRQVGRNDDALKQYLASRDLAGRLAASSPQNATIADCLARSYTGLGELCLNADRSKDAVQHFLKALVLVENSAAIQPDQGKARAALLEAYFRIGRAHGFDRELDRAVVWFRKMERLAERWVTDEPRNVLARDQLAISHRKIADCRKLAGDDVAARVEYAKAIDLGQKALATEPANVDVKLHLALALDDQTVTLRRLGLLEDAAPLAQQAEQLFTELAATDPEDVDSQMRLHQIQFHRGCLELDRLRVEAARGHLRRAVDGLTALDREGKLDGRARDKTMVLPIYKNEMAACESLAALPGDFKALRATPRPAAYRVLRIRAGLLASTGRLDDLPATVEALCDLDGRNPEDLYQLGRSLAWCAGGIDRLGETNASSEDNRKLRERVADRALAVLGRAAKAGLSHPSRVEIDGYLAPIREHAGFRKFSESLRTPAPGSGSSPNRDGRSSTIQTHEP